MYKPDPQVVSALLNAQTPEDALEVAAKSPMLLSLNAELILWNQERAATDFTLRGVYSMLRRKLREARTVAPPSTLIRGEIAEAKLSGDTAIEFPVSLAKDFAPIGLVQTRGAAATSTQRAAAMNALSELLHRFSTSNDAAVRAVMLMTRADLMRAWRLSSADVAPVFHDYREAADLFEDQGFPLWRARILNKLGNHCQTHPIGDIASSLRSAIEFHKQALLLFSEAEVTAERGDVLHNLGNDFTELHKQVGTGREEAINYYREALTIRMRDRNPRAFAETNHGLGRSLAMPATQETYRGSNIPGLDRLDEAIAAHHAGLAALEPSDSSSALYSALQHDLGVAYFARSQGHGDEGIETLTKAIHAFRAALRVRSPSIDAAEYATTQNALGVAYLSLPESPNTLREAEQCFREALRYRSFEREPDYFSDTNDNLGIVLLRMASDESGVQAALTYFEQALRARPRDTRPHGYIQSMMHFGRACEKLAELGMTVHKENAEKYFDEVASVAQSLGDTRDRASIVEELRSRPPAGHIW